MRRTGLFLPLVLLALSLFVPPAGAQQSATAEAPELGEVVVTATRIDSPILQSPSAITVVTSAQIAESGAHDLSEVLAGQAGTVTNDYGTAGSTKSVSLRGSTSAQVTVLLDGVKLNSSRDGLVDLSTIPMEIIDRVEILRGSASTIYGSGAIGGVVNIITKKAAAPRIDLTVTNGSYLPHAANTVSASGFPPVYTLAPAALEPLDLVDSQNVELSVAGTLGGVGLTGGGSFTRAANSFSWYDTTHLDTWRRRINADVLSGSAFAGATLPLLGGTASVKAVAEASDVGSPGSLTTISTTARQSDASASGSLSWVTDRFFTDALTFDLKAFYRYDVLTYNDPAYPPQSVHRTHTATLDLTQKLTVSDALAAVYGGNAAFDHVDSTNFAAPQQRLDLAGFLSIPVTPVTGLTVTPAVRYDWFSDFAGAVSGSLSAVLLLSDSLSLRISGGTAYRVPTLNDLYWYDPSGSAAANPNLKPETAYTGEIGLAAEAPRLSLDLSVFGRYVLDNIVWLYDPTIGPFGTYLPKNLTKTFFPGAEIHGKFGITDTVSLEASYTFLYSFLLNDGTTELSAWDDRRVPYTPIHSLRVQATYATPALEVGLTERYEAKQYTDSANTESSAMQAYFVTDVRGRVGINDVLSVTLALKNLFNALYYTQLGYPMPPFSIEAGMRLHL